MENIVLCLLLALATMWTYACRKLFIEIFTDKAFLKYLGLVLLLSVIYYLLIN